MFSILKRQERYWGKSSTNRIQVVEKVVGKISISKELQLNNISDI